MSRQIEQALLSLMPTYGADLPPSLVELAGSMLAQSRHKASTLKADEEVARLYACAHLACDRLKISMDLPPIAPRPPIPPRIYQRLYSHLDNILPNSSTPRRAGSARKRTPSSKLVQGDNSPSPSTRRVPSRNTPSKESSLARFRTGAASSEAVPGSVTHNSLHAWIYPVTRFFCSETGQRKLVPTMLAGMEAIVTPLGQRTGDEWVCDHITSLFAAIYFFVITRVKATRTGEAVDRNGYVPVRKEILALLSRARQEVTVKDVSEEAAWEGWDTVRPRDFDLAVAQVNEREWLTGDWFKALADVMRHEEPGNGSLHDGDGNDVAQSQVRRADTMFQDKYDYLNESRKADYKVWREAMLSKISQASHAPTAMEVDA